jgi:hypothetical protein
LISGTAEIGENATNEANFDEAASIAETQEAIKVTADSSVPSGLDNGVAQRGNAACRNGGEPRASTSAGRNPKPQGLDSSDRPCRGISLTQIHSMASPIVPCPHCALAALRELIRLPEAVTRGNLTQSHSPGIAHPKNREVHRSSRIAAKAQRKSRKPIQARGIPNGTLRAEMALRRDYQTCPLTTSVRRNHCEKIKSRGIRARVASARADCADGADYKTNPWVSTNLSCQCCELRRS